MLIFFAIPACDCEPEGISSGQCHRATGQCACLEGFSGHRCDRCARGYKGDFPICKPCHQCFSVWDTVVGELTNQTRRLEAQVTELLTTGVTAPYKELISNLERNAKAVREIVLNKTASEKLENIQDLIHLIKYVITSKQQDQIYSLLQYLIVFPVEWCRSSTGI